MNFEHSMHELCKHLLCPEIGVLRRLGLLSRIFILLSALDTVLTMALYQVDMNACDSYDIINDD